MRFTGAPYLSSRLLSAAFAGVCLVNNVFGATVRPPPVEAFFSPLGIVNPKLSPDGRHLAYGRYVGGDNHVLDILNLETMEPSSFGSKDRTTQPTLWLDNKGIICFSGIGSFGLIELNSRRNTLLNFTTSLRIFGPRKKPAGTLNMYFPDQSHGFSIRGLAIVNPRRLNPNVLGQRNDAYNLVARIELPPGEFRSAFDDWRGELRLIVNYDRSARKQAYYYRATESSPWSRLELDPHDDTFLGFSTDPDVLYVAHCDEKDSAAALYSYSVSRRIFIKREFGHDQFSMDTAQVLQDRRDGRLLGYRYVAEMQATHWVDATMLEIQRDIDRRFPGATNTITDYDEALTRFCILSQGDRAAPQWLLYSRDTGKLSLIGESYPNLTATPLATVNSIAYKARDGLRIPGYITVPPFPREDGKKPALVVLCHGGPWLRDDAAFNPEAQFLASRGYVVFQPNFRGSNGLTRDVSDDHRYDFKAMHEDVTDGVKALKQSGLIDPDRVAIMGGSFGGYQAIAGAAFEPDLYKCAVTIAGVFDWADIVSQNSADRFDRFNYDILIDKLGDPKVHPEKFASISPLAHTKDIKIPIYISAGTYDPVVHVRQSKDLAKKLRAEGKIVEEFIATTEGHGYFESKNRFRLYREIEAFLAKYL